MTAIYELDNSVDITSAITWQYNNSPAIIELIRNEQEFYNDACKTFFDDWYKNVFNLNTATYFGCLIWAIVLGCTEYVEMTQRSGTKSFGFGDFHKNFFQTNFALSSFIQTLSFINLQKLLKAQMLNFHSNASIADLNRVLWLLFPDHHPYVTVDLESNLLNFNFTEELNDDDLNLVMFSNILPVPVGIKRNFNNGIQTGGE